MGKNIQPLQIRLWYNYRQGQDRCKVICWFGLNPYYNCREQVWLLVHSSIYLHTKKYGNVACKDLFNFVDIYLAAQFLLHRGYRFIVYPAGDNIFKIIKIGIYVKCQSMHGYPTATANTHSAYFTGFFVI